MNDCEKDKPELIYSGEQGAEGKTELQSTLTDTQKSSFQKYKSLVVGERGFLYFAIYELLVCLIGPLPGAIGLLLRSKLYPFLFASVGKKVIFGRSMTIRHPHKIHIGDNTVFDDYVVLDAKGQDNKGIWIGDNVLIGRATCLSCKNGDIRIGNNTNIAMNCFFQSAKKVIIEEYVLFGAYCYVVGGGDHQTDRVDVPILCQGQMVSGIKIEKNCWLGGGVLVQDGIEIGRDSIIGSGAVVRSDVPAFSIAAGVPAKVKKSRKA